jgi:hypothetical protein
MRIFCRILGTFAGLVLATAPALGQQAEDKTSSRLTVDSNPSNASNNPLTPKITGYAQTFFMPQVEGEGRQWSTQELFRLYYPFDLGSIQNMLRIYAPVDQKGPYFGLGDWTVFNLFLHKIGSFELGAGPLLVVPTGTQTNMGTGKWQAGLAGLVVKKWSWGLTAATVTYSHSFAGDPSRPTVEAIGVQPLLFYNLDNGVYLRSTGIWNLAFGTGPSYIPIGFGIGKVWSLPSGTTLNLHLEPQYSVYHSETGAPIWQVLAGLIVQF